MNSAFIAANAILRNVSRAGIPVFGYHFFIAGVAFALGYLRAAMQGLP